MANNRVKDPAGRNPYFPAFLLGGALWIAFVVWVSVQLGHKLNGTGDSIPNDFFDAFFGVLGGKVAWLLASTWISVGFGVVTIAAAVMATRMRGHSKKDRTRVDHAAAHMGAGRDIEEMSETAARATAQRLGVEDAPGIPLGLHATTKMPLWATWELMLILIWGPRTGKTTSAAIPAILAAPGAVLATSNKRDVLDATRLYRAQQGQVWAFDPQGVALEPATWYWNPLSYVTDEVSAAKLAQHFATGSRPADAKIDAYFDPAGQDLLAGLLLAAAIDGRQITQVYRWLTRPTETEPVGILEKAGYELIADQVSGVVNAPDKQRGGIFGTAQQMAACLTNSQILKWITRTEDDAQPTFDPHAFARSSDTLYSMSKEGPGTAGPLVTALTVAVVEAAEELAAASPSGRLKKPLVGILDEAANVCRWKNLPDLYSHYGSRGIILMTILQSWSQGVEVWGEFGMRKLWSAANIASYGGGVKETSFLRDLSELIGDHDRVRTSVSYGPQHTTTSKQVQRERTLDVAELGAMPKGRAVIIASGSRPTLIRTVPWMVGPHAAIVRESILQSDPEAQKTLTEAEQELQEVAANIERLDQIEGVAA